MLEEELPEYLRTYTGYVDEYHNEPISKREWERRRRNALQVKKPRVPRSSATRALLTETIAIYDEMLERRLPTALYDRIYQHRRVVAHVMQQAHEEAAWRRDQMHKLHAEGRVYKGGRPKIALLVRSPSGEEQVVYGYEAAAALTGVKAASIAPRMSLGRGRAILGRYKDGKDCWTVERIGTKDATLHEPCQKPENEADEKSSPS